MPTLYELGEGARGLLDALTSASQEEYGAENRTDGGILNRSDWEAFNDARIRDLAREYLEAAGDIETKLDNYGLVMAELTASCEARAAEAKRLKALADADSRAIEAMKSTVDLVMDLLGYKPGDKVKTAHFNIGRQYVGGKLPLIVDEEHCPDGWFDMIPKINMDRVREALENTPEACSPWAHFGERKTRVAFR